MDCRELEMRLEALLDGALAPAEAAACRAHAAGCPVCRDLLELAGHAGAARAIEDSVDLAAQVLARTSGSACGRARELLPARIDGGLAGADGELVDLHLETCHDCRDLARTLVALRVDLPTMASLRPDEHFTRDVLAATLPVATRLRRWWRETWPTWLRRPRFAWEAAYVATLILILLVTLPGSPAAALPSKALEIARAEPPSVAPVTASAREWLVSAVRGVWDPVAEGVEHRVERGSRTARGLACEADARARRGMAQAREEIGTLLDAAASLLTRADEQPPRTTEDTEA